MSHAVIRYLRCQPWCDGDITWQSQTYHLPCHFLYPSLISICTSTELSLSFFNNTPRLNVNTVTAQFVYRHAWLQSAFPIALVPPSECHHPASFQTAVVVACAGNSSAWVKNTDKLQIHTIMHTTIHKWEWHAFVDQSDACSKWMHKLVQATQCLSDQLKRAHDSLLISVANASMGDT